MKGKMLMLTTCLLILITPCYGLSLGVSPSIIEYENLGKGISYDFEIYLSNTGNEECYYTYCGEGLASDWILLYDGNEILETPIKIDPKSEKLINGKLTIPKDAASEEYKVTLTFKTDNEPSVSEEEQGYAVSTPILEVPLKLKFTVIGEQILTGEVLELRTSTTEENAPIKIHLEFENTGNVQAAPEMSGVIRQEGVTVTEIQGTGDFVNPGKKEEILILSEAALSEGDYQAEITISLNEDILKTETLPLKVLPEGSLSKEASLLGMSVEGEPAKDSLLKVLASVENTGTADLSCKYIGEVYLEGSLKEFIESDELFIPVGKTKDISVYYTPTDIGDYEIRGKIRYAGQESEVKTVDFSTAEVKSVDSPSVGSTPGFGTLIALLCFMLAFLKKKM